MISWPSAGDRVSLLRGIWLDHGSNKKYSNISTIILWIFKLSYIITNVPHWTVINNFGEIVSSPQIDDVHVTAKRKLLKLLILGLLTLHLLLKRMNIGWKSYRFGPKYKLFLCYNRQKQFCVRIVFSPFLQFLIIFVLESFTLMKFIFFCFYIKI